MQAKQEKINKVEAKEKEFEVLEFPGAEILPDRKRIQAQINSRKQKLEKIKSFLALKTYNLLSEKLQREEDLLAQKLSAKEKQVQKENEFSPMPKIFFEQKSLKPKAIRIE